MYAPYILPFAKIGDESRCRLLVCMGGGDEYEFAYDQHWNVGNMYSLRVALICFRNCLLTNFCNTPESVC